jgi:perosamine synthetase
MKDPVIEIPRAIRTVVGPGEIGLHDPCIGGRESQLLNECLDSGMVSSVGAFVSLLERNLEDFTGATHAVVTSSGTAALQLALLAVGVTPGDEVITTPLSFVATANAIAHCGARPHFVDIETDTFGIDPQALTRQLDSVGRSNQGVLINGVTGNPIRALLAVHVFGNPCNVEQLKEVALRFKLPLVEDAAESLGSWAGSSHTGTIGRVGTFSFNGNKVVTTGGGGAVVTHSDELAAFVRHLSTTAKVPHPWAYHHDQVGFNYRMPNVNAALGVAQMEQLPNFLDAKRRLHGRYEHAFEGMTGIRLLSETANSRSNYWLNTLRLQDGLEGRRDELLNVLNSQGISSRPAWELLSDLPAFAGCPTGDVHTAQAEAPRLLSLPSGPRLGALE